MSKQQVSKFSGLFNLIVKLKWIIPVIALVLAILAVVLAMERRKTLLRLAVGVALVTLLLLAGAVAGPHHLPQPGRRRRLQPGGGGRGLGHRVALPQDRPALDAAGVGAGGLGAWLAGPARYAVWIRRPVPRAAAGSAPRPTSSPRAPGGRRAGQSRVRRTGGWILEHLNGLRIVGVIVAALFLVFGGNLTGLGTPAVIVIVLAVYLGLLQLVAAWARKASGSTMTSGTT